MRNLFFVLVTSIALLCNGCSTNSQLKQVETVASIQFTVDELMQAYAYEVALGNVSLEDRVKVRELYRKYEFVENNIVIALELADIDLASKTDAELADLAFELTIFLLTIVD